MIFPYQTIHHQACKQIFDSNTPPYFDETEAPALTLWLKAKDEGRLAYASNLAEYFFVLYENDNVVACAGYYVTPHEMKANLVWGMVDRQNHGRGYGTELMNFRIAHIREHYPQHTIILDTSQYCFLFFEKLGFEVKGIVENGYAKGLHRYDMVLLPKA